jgi:chitin disaccharide deacetylase
VKRLLVVADDVALHRSMTDGAIRAHREGIVTACSIVSCGGELAHALDALSDVPTLDAGVHLALVEERPLTDPAKVRSLVDGEGRFHASFVAFSRRLLSGRIDLGEVRRELRAQIEVVAASRIPIRHLNSHQHLHALPRIFEIVLDLAEEYGIRWVRVPFDPSFRSASASRRFALGVLNACALRGRAVAAARGILTADRAAGIAAAGHHDLASLLDVLRRVEGTVELVVHPGVSDQALAAAYDWGYAWERELEALCNPALRAGIEAMGFQLMRPSALSVAADAPPKRGN